MSISSPGFLIDLDGLLINSESLSEIAFEKMCSQLGCNFSQDYHARIRGTKPQVWSQSFVDTLRLDLSPSEVTDLHRMLLFEQLDKWVQLMPGAVSLLDWIQARSYATALVTSSDMYYARRYLSQVGIFDCFTEFVTSEDVEHGKPDPEPFLLGAKKIGINPTSCVVFEDSLSGVLSGKAAGAIVVAVPSTESDREKVQMADFVLASLVESITVLENLGL